MSSAWRSGNAGRMLKVFQKGGESELEKFKALVANFLEWVAEKRRGWAVVNRETGEVGKVREG